MRAFSEKGIVTKNSPLEVAEESDALITMLPSSAHVSFESNRWCYINIQSNMTGNLLYLFLDVFWQIYECFSLKIEHFVTFSSDSLGSGYIVTTEMSCCLYVGVRCLHGTERYP